MSDAALGAGVAPAETESLRERNKRRRTDRILDATLSLMREDLESVPTVERIATRAEVSPMTVFNLIGTRDDLWLASVKHALRGLDRQTRLPAEPRQRADHIVADVVRVLCADASVFRALLKSWHGDPLPGFDPTPDLVACFQMARDSGTVSGIDPQLYGEVVATGLLGAISQWATGMLHDRGLRARVGAIVDIAFTAAEHARP